MINKYLVADLKDLGLWDQQMVQQLKYHDGSIQEIDTVPDHLKEKYKEVFEVDASWVIKAAAARGKWIDQSQSVNIFIRGTSGKKISDTYTMAWKYGLKTTYYLRTLGATSVEKSTAVRKQGVVPTAPTPSAVPTPVVASGTDHAGTSTQDSVSMKKESVPVAASVSDEKKMMCSILNGPDCEACQ